MTVRVWQLDPDDDQGCEAGDPDHQAQSPPGEWPDLDITVADQGVRPVCVLNACTDVATRRDTSGHAGTRIAV